MNKSVKNSFNKLIFIFHLYYFLCVHWASAKVTVANACLVSVSNVPLLMFDCPGMICLFSSWTRNIRACSPSIARSFNSNVFTEVKMFSLP